MAEPRPYLLEQVDDVAVVQVYADGFSSLPRREKMLIWHLYQAALAGRDIYYDQRYRHNLVMREVLEQILTHRSGVDEATLAEIHRYTKLFWINTGPYNNLTARKFVLRVAPVRFAEAARAAAAAGAVFPLAPGETLDAMLARMHPFFFDPDFEPQVTSKSPAGSEDILAASANNLYENVAMSDVAGFEERYQLNSRLVKRDSRMVEEVYREGGRYGAEIARIISHLEDATAWASEPMAAALRALVRFYRTGEPEDRRAYDVAWVEDRNSPVDTINGFIEVYLDARSMKGAWEAIVFYVNREKTRGIEALAAAAQWFEDHMPFAVEYRKAGVRGISAKAVDVVVETGEAGPVTPVGINLPNDEHVREKVGSKSVSLSNVIEAYEKSTPPAFRREFSWTNEEAARAEKWGALASELTTNMHEVIGHASGKVNERLQVSPQMALREYFSALEESRADLIGLYFVADPKLVELGLVDETNHEEVVLAEYEAYTRNALVQLRRVRTGSQIEEDHMRNRQMIVHWLIDNTGAIEVRRRDGKTYYAMVDREQFREGVGRLLAEVQRIKSEGDYRAARALVETYGVRFDPSLRDEIVARVDELNLPSYTAFVMPELEAVIGPDGSIEDVSISYPLDLTRQMLKYSGKLQESAPETTAASGER
ncbi:MAG: peptidase M49 [Vicinamibacterales bacterium]